MSAWSGLLKKEFRLGLLGVIGALCLLVLCLGFGVFLSWKLDTLTILFAISFGLIWGHIFYLPGYLIVSLNGERGRKHLWLHSPQSGRALLSAKFLNGLFAMMISLVITGVIALYTGIAGADILNVVNITGSEAVVIGLLVIFHVIAASLYLTIWGVFLWTINQILGQFIGKLRWIVLIVLVICGLSLLSSWESSSLFMALTEWGAVTVDSFSSLFNGITFMIEEGGMSAEVETGMPPVLHIGSYVYYTLVAILVFLASSWLLDRKVEV